MTSKRRYGIAHDPERMCWGTAKHGQPCFNWKGIGLGDYCYRHIGQLTFPG